MVRERADADLALSGEQGIAFFSAHGAIFKGWALVELGHAEEGLEQMQEGLKALRAMGVEIEGAHFLGLLAEAQARAGRAADGLRAIEEALREVERHGARFYQAELYRLKGDLLLMQPTGDAESRHRIVDEAERCLRMAIEVARRQQAKSLELRAAISLARLWQRHGRPAAAHELLAGVFGWFTEGFETPDLREARALLDRLVLTAHG